MTSPHDNPNRLTPLRLACAVALGLLGGFFIWVTTPYVDVVINCNANAADLCDGYLPKGAMFVLLVAVLALNPLLIRRFPRLALNKRQIALVLGLALVSSSVPGDGLLRRLPYQLVGVPFTANMDKQKAEAYRKLHLPPSLFPSRIEYGLDPLECRYFIQELPPADARNPTGPKAPLPWRAWLGPALAWGTFFGFAWALMIGMAQIVVPQWQRNERLPFPLLALQDTLIQSPGEGRCVAPIFRNRLFWLTAGTVLVLTALDRIQPYLPGVIPSIPLSWDLSRCFTEVPLTYLPAHIKGNSLFFIVIGVAFVMPARISFSLWFFVLAYAGYRMVGTAYFPPFDARTIEHQQTGAMLALTVAVLWLGRKQWAKVFSLLWRRAADEEERMLRRAAVLFLVGGAGMAGWLIWAGMSPGWALLFVAGVFMISLIIARVVAETGMPNIRLPSPEGLMAFAPTTWLSAGTLYFWPLLGQFFAAGSIANPAALGSHAIAIDSENTPRERSRAATIFLCVLLVSLMACGAVHLYGNYHHSVTMDGRETPLNPFWFNYLNWSLPRIHDLESGGRPIPTTDLQLGHVAFGAGLAGLLEWASLSFPTWGLHPLGMLVSESWDISRCWASLFIGWLLKILILRYGGSGLYRAAMPAFIGLIVGDVIHLVFWGLLPAVLVFTAPQWLP